MKPKDLMKGFIGVVIVLGFLAVTAWCVYSDNQHAPLLVGALASQAGAVVQYYIGSSQGSARKTEIMATSGGQ